MLRVLAYLSSLISSSSPASSSSSGSFLRSLLSFGASDSPPLSPAPPGTPLPQPTTDTAPMDIELGTPSPPPGIPDVDRRREDAAADAKRVAKLVQPVALAVAAGSLVLFVNAPAADQLHPELGAAYVAFVCLALFTSLGLSMHAVVNSGDPGAAPLHKRVLLVAIFFVLCAAVLRFTLVFPAVFSEHVLAFFVLGALAFLLYLRIARKIDRDRAEPTRDSRA